MLMENFKFDKSVVICALARDCSGALANNIPRIQELREFFADSEVIVIENDSKDNTKEVLASWHQNFLACILFLRITILNYTRSKISKP